MALKRLTRDHHNMHKRHLVIGDAMAVIFQHSAEVDHRLRWHQFAVQRRSRDRPLHQWRPAAVSEHVEPLFAPDTNGLPHQHR